MPNTIETNLQRLLTATSDIADAIEAKGGTVGANDGLEAFPTAIANIPVAGITDVQYTTRTLTKSVTGSQQPETVFTTDNTPTQNSNNPISSGAIYSSLSVMNDILEDVLHSRTKIVISGPSGTVYNVASTGNTYTGTISSSGTATIPNVPNATYTINATYNSCPSEQQTLVVSAEGTTYNVTLAFITLAIEIPNESTYTITDGTTTYTGTSTGTAILYYLPNTGTWTVSCTDGEQTASESVTVSTYTAYSVSLSYVHIYGIVWDKTNDGSDSQNPAITRTDESALFSNPNPYYSGMSGTPSSPFDTLQPWAGMVKETVDGNSMVKIPKFYYKIVNGSSSMTIQIADGPKDGFKISPAHRAQNANDTIKDYIYIGRYKCNSSYGSTTGQTPKVSVTRSDARNGCRALDNSSGKYDQLDFATWWTIRMLYLVEFADWNSQACIGYGCGNGSSKGSTGYTDSMSYHTGTTQSSRTTYGLGTQYRWIEGLWDNVLEWCDGITFNGTDVYTFNDRANYSDSYTATGAIKVGTRSSSSEYIVDYFTPSTTSTVDYDIDWMMYSYNPNSKTGSSTTYVCDYCGFNSSGVVLFVGGVYYQYQYYGLGCAYGSSASSGSHSYLGVRLLRYP